MPFILESMEGLSGLQKLLYKFVAGAVVGVNQALQPVPHYEPTPPEHSFDLPPNLNSADLEQLLELPLSPELAEQIIATRPHLNWAHLEGKFPELPHQTWQPLRGKVRF